MSNTFFGCRCYNIYDNLIGVYHIRIFVKADTPICNTSENPCEIWRDRAGAYGIQDPFGMKFIRKINGCYYNVVGLPVSRLYEELKKLGAI